MPSPFPGMDPYLEVPDRWGGVHLGLLYALHAELNRALPEGFVARLDQFVWVRDEGGYEARRKPDVFVPEPTTPGGTATLAEPVTRPTTRTVLPRGRKRNHRFVRITTTDDQQVLTVLEVLTPSNKGGGEDREAYAQKRREYLSSVNLVEIDLLRDGGRFPLGRPSPPAADYCVFSCRADAYPAADVWAFNVRDELPIIPIPIAPDVPDVSLRLRSALDRVYDDGRYSDQTDYSTPPAHPLRASDAGWAADLLKKHAKKRKP